MRISTVETKQLLCIGTNLLIIILYTMSLMFHEYNSIHLKTFPYHSRFSLENHTGPWLLHHQLEEHATSVGRCTLYGAPRHPGETPTDLVDCDGEDEEVLGGDDEGV